MSRSTTPESPQKTSSQKTPSPKTKPSPKPQSSRASKQSTTKPSTIKPSAKPQTAAPSPKPKPSAKVKSSAPPKSPPKLAAESSSQRPSAQKPSPPKSAPSPKSSQIGDYARLIGQALAAGRPPSFSDDDFERFCAGSPHEIYPAFAGVARHMPPAGDDEELALGYLFVLQHLLEHLRIRAGSGFAGAAQLIAEFQADVAALVNAGEVDDGMLVLVGGALHQSKIPASPEFIAASTKAGVDEDGGEVLPADIRLAFGEIVNACDGDPFMTVELLLEAGHAMPPDARGALAGALALSGIPGARSAAVLLLLDPEPATRRAAADALLQVAASLTPADVRRLIAMRNWRPENERSAVDAVIRKARAAGIDCAQWEEASVEKIMATCVDGSGSQLFAMVSPVGPKKKMLSSVMTRDGISDAMCLQPGSRREVEACLDELLATPTLPVSRAYLDRNMAHQLALVVEGGGAAPAGLLQVAEAIGGADWQPAQMDLRQALAGLIADVPKRMREPAARAAMLRESGELADLQDLAMSWYEEDPEVAAAVAGTNVRRAKLATYLLQTVIGRRRDRWAEIMLRTALWLRGAGPEPVPGWSELALIAKALADGQDLTEIGLMHDIAMRTITVLRQAGQE
jgi:hypothetical protein